MPGDTFQRFTRIVRSRAHGFLDQLEDSEKMVRQAIRDMEDAVGQGVEAVAAAMANQRRLEKQEQQMRAGVGLWQEKAERAVARGDEEYARRAVAEKSGLMRRLEDLAPALEEARETAAQLRIRLAQMQQRLQEAKNRQGSLLARCRATGGPLGRQSESSLSAVDSPARMERMEQRVRAHVAELARFAEQVDAAEAAADLFQEMAEARRSERRLQEMETERRVEEELAVLRRKAARES